MAKVKPIEQRPGRGRPVSQTMIDAMKDCFDQGLSYVGSVPILISKGFVNENGECCITRRMFEYTRTKFVGTKLLNISIPSASYDWIMGHKEEFLALVASKASEASE